MKKPRICAAIIDNDLEAVREIEPFVDLFEVRIDIIGDGWQRLAKQFEKPWIACNRRVDEGGRWEGDEARRVERLLRATELGADIIATACPFCLLNIEDAVKIAGLEDKLEVKDIMELVAEAI